MVAKDEPGQEAPKTTPEDARIDSLEERLRRAQAREEERTRPGAPKIDQNESMGNRVISYLIGGLFGGTLIGWVLDRIFDTGGLLLVGGLVIGIIGGFWSIVRLSGQKPAVGTRDEKIGPGKR